MNDFIQPNSFAYFALLIWPLVALCLFARLSVAQATLWTVLGGYLLLPFEAEIKIPMVPLFSKSTIPNIAAFIGCALYARRLPKFAHGFGLAEVLILTILFGPFVTSMLNTDAIRVGPIMLPGVGAYDGGSQALFEFIFILPFFLGRQFLRSAEDNAEILRITVIAGLAYSLPMLFEVRVSPQLSNWIYGYEPNSFLAGLRGGGFRPVVFLTGLLTAFFAMTAAVAAATLWRTQIPTGRLPPGAVTFYLSIVLALCKTLSTTVYGVVLISLVRWASPRLQLRVACVFVIIALSYPILRVADLIPSTSILEVAGTASADRQQSLETRFVWENRLLERAWQRPWFGWGRYGRSRIVDAEAGDRSITDGYWIITMGTFGLVGFVAQFGLLALPVFRAARALKFTQSRQEGLYLAALALIVAVNMVDLLPNSSMSPWTWLLAGATLGRAEASFAAARQRTSMANLQPLPM